MAERQKKRMDGQEVIQIHVRMNTELHEAIKESAERNRRSLNAEILVMLEQHYLGKK